MIQILRDIGQRLPREIPYSPVRDETHLFFLDAHERRVASETLDSQKARRYTWVGNRKGNLPKDRLIVEGSAIRYLIFTTPWLLQNLMEGFDAPGADAFRERLENFRRVIGERELRSASGETFRMLQVDTLLDPQTRQRLMEVLHRRIQEDTGAELPFPSDPEEAFQIWAFRYAQPDGFEKAFRDVFQSMVTEGLPRKAMVLWTYRDAQGVLSEDPAYRAYVAHTFQPQLEEARESICHLCGKRAPVTAKTRAFQFFKFFNTDKPGFAPHLRSENFSAVLGLCASCYADVLYGDRFVFEHLRTYLAGLDVVLLPHPVPDRKDLHELARVLTRRLNAAATVDQWHEFQKVLEEQAELWEDLRTRLFMHLVFVERAQSAVKVLKIIHQVPPSRLDELDQARRIARRWALRYFRDVGKKKSLWDLDLQTQYTLLPPHKDTRTPSLFLSFLEALLHGTPFPRPTALRHFLRVARAHALGSTQIFRGLPRRTVEQFMVQTLVLDRYAQHLGVFPPLPTGGGSMVLERVPEHLRDYVTRHVPEGKARGLFLLGYVIGLIARAQQEGVSREEAKSPPILNAISFTGMDEPRVRRLVNQVADRMRHYLKGWDYDEGERVLAAALTLLSEGTLSLPPYENTYWVLAGYGFARLGLRKKANQEENHD